MPFLILQVNFHTSNDFCDWRLLKRSTYTLQATCISVSHHLVYTLIQSYKRTFSISFFRVCADDIEMFFLPKFVHLHGQKFSGVLEKFSCTSSFFG